MKELGIARSVAVKQVGGTMIDKDVNAWLEKNPNVEVIDIKFAESATHDEWGSGALIIYRKES